MRDVPSPKMRSLTTTVILIGFLALASGPACSKGESKEVAAAAEADKNTPAPKETLLILKFHTDT